MGKRNFVMLAETYKDGKYGIASWFASEKLDGCRAFWDGGITRGKFADEVPFANTDKKAHLLQRRVATGLWSRYGNVISAPNWWLDTLPEIPLDGELFAGRSNFQLLRSIVADHVPSLEWNKVKFLVFDSPPLSTIFADGKIELTNFKKEFNGLQQKLGFASETYPGFEQRYKWLTKKLNQNEIVRLHHQEQLPYITSAALERMDELLETITSNSGEGLILRAPHSVWVPERVKTLLKVKPMHDMEGRVIGYVWGRKTALGSKLLGLMGALVLRLDNGIRLELSGFTDEERKMLTYSYESAHKIGEQHPGEVCGTDVFNPTFLIGSRVSFKYRELSDAGVPKEARYWRKK